MPLTDYDDPTVVKPIYGYQSLTRGIGHSIGPTLPVQPFQPILPFDLETRSNPFNRFDKAETSHASAMRHARIDTFWDLTRRCHH